ncbi:MAG: type II toxin-antitoxin system HicA family toxin [Oscillospiraceae bacterium]|nr:type II toxin-antitoxin system HicA family toxin [Oscillospiraceae bacterium]
MPMTPKEIIKLLEGNGFQLISQNGSHKKFKHSNGKIVIVPDHKGTLKPGTESNILKQAGLK